MSKEYVNVKIQGELYRAAENYYRKYERYYRDVGVNSVKQLIRIWALELMIKLQEKREAERK